MEKGKNKNLIITLVAVVIIGLAGYFYATRDRTSDVLLTSSISTTTAGVDGDLLSALRELRRLKLDDSIFTNKVWLSLKDSGKTLEQQPSGRPNPFAPLDAVIVAAPVTAGTPTVPNTTTGGAKTGR